MTLKTHLDRTNTWKISRKTLKEWIVQALRAEAALWRDAGAQRALCKIEPGGTLALSPCQVLRGRGGKYCRIGGGKNNVMQQYY